MQTILKHIPKMSPSLPKTYKAAVVEEANGKLNVKDVPLKEPQHGQILVKVKACGVCHSDEVVRTGGFGNPYVEFPLAHFTADMFHRPIVPGHEVIGSVVALGPDEKKWKVGDLVGELCVNLVIWRWLTGPKAGPGMAVMTVCAGNATAVSSRCVTTRPSTESPRTVDVSVPCERSPSSVLTLCRRRVRPSPH